jgi:hypothetical protein
VDHICHSRSVLSEFEDQVSRASSCWIAAQKTGEESPQRNVRDPVTNCYHQSHYYISVPMCCTLHVNKVKVMANYSASDKLNFDLDLIKCRELDNDPER